MRKKERERTMEKEFEASNGYVVRDLGQGSLEVGDIRLMYFHEKALREYFQHEKDRELNRWRDPEYPLLVMYAMGQDSVRVLDEVSGNSYRINRSALAEPTPITTFIDEAARRYFEAHPAQEPERPWENAEPGDIWVISFRSADLQVKDIPVSVRLGPNTEAMFCVGATYIETTNPAITAGHRIWPEVDGDKE